MNATLFVLLFCLGVSLLVVGFMYDGDWTYAVSFFGGSLIGSAIFGVKS